MTRRKLWMLGVLGGATLLVLAVLAVSWDRFHGWLDGTAPLAEWLVAGGTFILALATFRLAQQTAEEAKQVKLEASAVTKQVELQSEQAAAAVRPVVYPIANEEWTKTRRSTLLMVRNGGAGPAVSVKGKIFWQRGGGSEAETKVWESGSLGAGEVRWFRLAKPGVDDWNNARGELNFTDLNDEKWQTYFESTIEDGDIVVVRVVAINRLI